MSAKFTDRLGREFACVVTVAEAEQLKNELQVDLGNITESDLFGKLSIDWRLLVDVIGVVAAESIAGHGITDPRELARGLDGNTLGAAFDAIWEAIADFFPPRMRLALREMIAKSKEAEAKAVDAVVMRTRAISTEKIVQDALTSFDSVGGKPPSGVSA